VYNNPNPPAPNDVQGFLAGEPVKDSMTFEGPHKDKYHFSIWTVDSAGNKSAGYNTQAQCTNYWLGDFRAEAGCLDFPGEFLQLALHYGENDLNPGFLDSIDIGPTSDASGTGLPMPDGLTDFEDLVIFGMNYDEHSCGFAAAGQSRPSMESSPASARPVKMIADVPGSVRSGAEYTVVLRAANDELAGIKAYHVILNYNHDVAELVKIEAGAMHSSVAEQFFFVDKTKTNIDITGAVFGAGVVFTGEEIARVTFKAKANGDLALTSDKLDLRDRSNGRIESSLAFNQSIGTLPAEFALAQNYPNPFNPTTSIELAIPTACDYTLTIYNITGQAVDVFKGHSEPGYLKINWNAQNFASGIYLYKMVTDKFTDTKKMVLLK